jgi:hypothetical protein
MRHFEHFACIDWSGAQGRWHKGIALAVCDVGQSAPLLIAPPNLHWTRGAVLEWLREQAMAQRNIIIGLDLSFALPFDDMGSYFPGWDQSPANAKQLWARVDRLSQPDPHLAANSFIDHPEIARHFRQRRNCGDLFGSGRGRLRKCEYDGQAKIAGINPYSCFNLIGAAQVGKSSLTGMRVLHQLDSAIPIWPFDPLPDSGSEAGPVIVEIYTSIAARASHVLAKGKSKITDGTTLDQALAAHGSDPHLPFPNRYTDHATDAILTSAWLRKHAHRTDYWEPKAMTSKFAATEGWTFGVV